MRPSISNNFLYERVFVVKSVRPSVRKWRTFNEQPPTAASCVGYPDLFKHVFEWNSFEPKALELLSTVSIFTQILRQASGKSFWNGFRVKSRPRWPRRRLSLGKVKSKITHFGGKEEEEEEVARLRGSSESTSSDRPITMMTTLCQPRSGKP